MTQVHSKNEGLSIAAVAADLGVHPNTVRNWIKDGVLPATRLGPRTIRIHPDDITPLRKPA